MFSKDTNVFTQIVYEEYYLIILSYITLSFIILSYINRKCSLHFETTQSLIRYLKSELEGIFPEIIG